MIISSGPETNIDALDRQLLPELISKLKGSQFAHVQSVVFPVMDIPWYGDMKTYIKTELREWDRNGVLTFADEWQYSLVCDINGRLWLH